MYLIISLRKRELYDLPELYFCSLNSVCHPFCTMSFNLIKQIPLILKPRFWTCICSYLMILFIPKFMINVTILILKLSISFFKMVMFLALHPMEFIFLNSSDLLEHLPMLLTSTLTINC